VKRIATVTGAEIDDDATETGRPCRDLTDVYVDEPLSPDLAHGWMVRARGVGTTSLRALWGYDRAGAGLLGGR